MRTCLFWFLIPLAAGVAAASADELTVKEMGEARSVYVAKCAKCHEFYEPKKYSEPDWRKWMVKMEKKSKLKGEQASLLRQYLDDYRAGRVEGKAEGDAKAGRRGGSR
jgi:cytochrome c553